MGSFKKWCNDNQGIIAIISIIISIILAALGAWLVLIIFGCLFVFIGFLWLYNKIYHLIMFNNKKLEILKADYGSGTIFIDITNQLKDLIDNNRINMKLSNGILGYDPTPNVIKHMKITYKWNDKTFNKKFIEGKMIDLP